MSTKGPEKELKINENLTKFKNNSRLLESKNASSKKVSLKKLGIKRRILKIFRRSCVYLAAFLAIWAILGLIFMCLLAFRRDLFYPTKYPATTTKASGSSQLNIGQLCQYNNQCPDNAYCSLTCQCPENYYFDSTSGSCIKTKTYNQACTYDYECNPIVQLICSQSTGKCDCNTNKMFWNSAFTSGAGQIIGRCQNLKGIGMACASVSEVTAGMNCAGSFGSTTSIARCFSNYQLDMSTGVCLVRNPSLKCSMPFECDWGTTFCNNIDGDGSSKCNFLPDFYYYNGYQTKATYLQSCSRYYICHEFQNLKCSIMSTNARSGVCVCLNKYYYHNGTMCIYGKRYGERCTTSTQCTPSSAGMVCDQPYTGASYSVCRCTIGSKYYDPYTETCQNYKSYGSRCTSNDQCYDAYMNGSALTSVGFCGYAPGSGYPTCLCNFDYYSPNGTCYNKINFNSRCNSTLTVPQCLANAYCDSSTNFCKCSSYKSWDSTNLVCFYRKYLGDTCAFDSECWSNSCSTTTFKCI